MRPEKAARTLAIIGSILLIAASLLRLVSVYLMMTDQRLQPDYQLETALAPTMGMYRFSADGTQVQFQRGVISGENWTGQTYLLDLADGRTRPGNLPEVEPLFEVSDNQIRYKTGEQSPGLAVTLSGQRIINPVFTPDGQQLAYIEVTGSSTRRLSAVRSLSPPQFILEADLIRDISWSPDGQQLVFISNVERQEEIFTYSFKEHHLLQLTADGRPKSSPVYSGDGQQIAFLAWEQNEQDESQPEAIPTVIEFNPDRAQQKPDSHNPDPEVYVVQADGGNLRAVTDNDDQEFAPAWTADNRVAYSVWLDQWPSVAYLYSAAPSGQDERRIYPPVAIETLECSPALPGGSRARLKITVSNTGNQEIEFPLEASASRLPIDVLTSRSEFRVQREDFTLVTGETRTIDWTVAMPEDILIYLSATVESGVEFPVSAQFCQVTPRRLFIPRLPLIRTSLLLAIAGTLLSIPWLRHMKSRWLIGLWGFFWALLIVLLVIESLILPG